MQLKKKIVAFAVMLAVGCMGAFSGSVFAENKGPESVTLDYNHKKKKVANFPHHKHQEHNDCKTCHHKKEEGHDAKACRTCHAEGNKVAMKDAYHKRCKGCHKKEKKGPTKCKGCHGRK